MITDVTKVPVRPGESLSAAIIRCYHEAFIVQTIGAAAGGISIEEFQALKDCGLVAQSVRYGERPGPDNNEFLIVAMAAATLGRAPIENQPEMRAWPLEKWTAVMPAKSAQITVRFLPPTDTEATPTVGSTTTAGPTQTATSSAAEGKDIAFTAMQQTLTQREQHAFERVTRDAADFIRGLGNIIAEDWSRAQVEVWNGELPLEVPDPEKRRERIAAIREVLKEAVQKRWSPQKTASAMAKATQDYARNWRRVAETELQALFNDAAVLSAMENFGRTVRIARVPDTTACKPCLTLFLGEDGTPILFDPVDLARNGTNVGKPRSEWKPTIYPLHPRCRCGVQAVPPGWEINRYGRLTKVKAPE